MSHRAGRSFIVQFSAVQVCVLWCSAYAKRYVIVDMSFEKASNTLHQIRKYWCIVRKKLAIAEQYNNIHAQNERNMVYWRDFKFSHIAAIEVFSYALTELTFAAAAVTAAADAVWLLLNLFSACNSNQRF